MSATIEVRRIFPGIPDNAETRRIALSPRRVEAGQSSPSQPPIQTVSRAAGAREAGASCDGQVSAPVRPKSREGEGGMGVAVGPTPVHRLAAGLGAGPRHNSGSRGGLTGAESKRGSARGNVTGGGAASSRAFAGGGATRVVRGCFEAGGARRRLADPPRATSRALTSSGGTVSARYSRRVLGGIPTMRASAVGPISRLAVAARTRSRIPGQEGSTRVAGERHRVAAQRLNPWDLEERLRSPGPAHRDRFPSVARALRGQCRPDSPPIARSSFAP